MMTKPKAFVGRLQVSLLPVMRVKLRKFRVSNEVNSMLKKCFLKQI